MSTSIDYARPTIPTVPPALTTAQRRRRRRLVLVLLAALALCFIPYPTLVFPAVTLQFVDAAGRPLDYFVPIRWEGFTNVADVSGVIRCDPGGRVTLPARRVWASPASRLVARVIGLLPHQSGYRATSARIHFDLRTADTLDDKAMALPLHHDSFFNQRRRVWGIGRPGDEVIQEENSPANTVWITFESPGSGSRNYTLRLRRAIGGSSTQPMGTNGD